LVEDRASAAARAASTRESTAMVAEPVLAYTAGRGMWQPQMHK
jgi:hypothetical protein